MKKLLISSVIALAFGGQVYAENCQLNGKDVVCDGVKIGETWCGFTGCEGLCNDRAYGSVKKYGSREKAAESVVRECKR